MAITGFGVTDDMKFAQMLANGGRVDRSGSGERLIGRKTVELM